MCSSSGPLSSSAAILNKSYRFEGRTKGKINVVLFCSGLCFENVCFQTPYNVYLENLPRSLYILVIATAGHNK